MIKPLKKMPKMIGTVPRLYSLYNREVVADMCRVSNAHSDAIDYLYSVICEQQKTIEELQKQIERNNNA